MEVNEEIKAKQMISESIEVYKVTMANGNVHYTSCVSINIAETEESEPYSIRYWVLINKGNKQYYVKRRADREERHRFGSESNARLAANLFVGCFIDEELSHVVYSYELCEK